MIGFHILVQLCGRHKPSTKHQHPLNPRKTNPARINFPEGGDKPLAGLKSRSDTQRKGVEAVGQLEKAAREGMWNTLSCP